MPKNSHTLELEAAVGDVDSVVLYSGRAEIKRVFLVTLQPGQTRIVISGLSAGIGENTLRVEAVGIATIQDVVVQSTVQSGQDVDDLKALQQKLEWYKHTIGSLNDYISLINAWQNVDAPQAIGPIKGGHGDQEIFCEPCQRESDSIETEPKGERKKIRQPIVIVLLDASQSGRVKVALTYDTDSIDWVTGATWDAKYSIRINSLDNVAMITYKATVINKTGESWHKTTLRLETGKLNFDLAFPALNTWNLGLGQGTPSKNTSRSEKVYSEKDIEFYGLNIMSKGNVNFALSPSKQVSIPSDGIYYDVEICSFKVKSELLWTAIPKIDRRVYLKAKVKNDTEFPFIAGGANVYVDGNFTTHTSIPLVHIGESFECLLGIDPAVRITYHPRTKTITQSSTWDRKTTHSFSQRITVINSHPRTLESIKIMDNIPVRTDQKVAVVLHEPRLAESSCSLYTVPQKNGNQSRCRVVAQWEDAEGCSGSYYNRSFGKNGKINWFCTVPSNESVELTLRWDVTGPQGEEIQNLEPVDVD